MNAAHNSVTQDIPICRKQLSAIIVLCFFKGLTAADSHPQKKQGNMKDAANFNVTDTCYLASSDFRSSKATCVMLPILMLLTHVALLLLRAEESGIWIYFIGKHFKKTQYSFYL